MKRSQKTASKSTSKTKKRNQVNIEAGQIQQFGSDVADALKGEGAGAFGTSGITPKDNAEPPAKPAKAQTDSEPKHCPECGAIIPNRYRVCDDCLAKRHAAKKAGAGQEAPAAAV